MNFDAEHQKIGELQEENAKLQEQVIKLTDQVAKYEDQMGRLQEQVCLSVSLQTIISSEILQIKCPESEYFSLCGAVVHRVNLKTVFFKTLSFLVHTKPFNHPFR